MKYQMYKDQKGEWRWRFKAANGEEISKSSEGYVAKADCLNSIELNKKSGSAPVEEV